MNIDSARVDFASKQSDKDCFESGERSPDSGRNSSGGPHWFSSCEKGSKIVCPISDDANVNIMMTPEEKLCRWETRAQALEDAQQFDDSIQALVRCLALRRLVYGDSHLKLAQIHARLAQMYLQFKGWPLQAEEHSAQAGVVLSFYCPGPTDEEKVDVLMCLFTVVFIQGKAALLLGKLEEAEEKLEQVSKIFEELRPLNVVTESSRKQTEFDIATTMCRLYQRQGRPEDALCQCDRALQLRKEPEQACMVYKDMAAIMEAQGQLDVAVQHLLKALATVQGSNPGSLEEAHIAYSLAMAHVKAQESRYLDGAACFFEQSISIYIRCLGPQDPLTVAVQDEYCQHLLLNGQQEAAMRILKVSLPLKKNIFGDLSPKVAETLQLIGGVEMMQGWMRKAYRTMSKCLEIQQLLYGSQHRKTQMTQQTVDLLSKNPGIEKIEKTNTLKSRPPFCPVVHAQSTPAGTHPSSLESEQVKMQSMHARNTR